MGRLTCCDKKGLKKGSWTSEEDSILISYIQRYGHTNWRALPKQAGLLRCGKSCRLRWTNYLRPDIKRGHFTTQEEETIINMHQTIGNKWSAIAAKLPGRTDNEIKNHWRTHLAKRLTKNAKHKDTETIKDETLEVEERLSSTERREYLEQSSNSLAIVNKESELEGEASTKDGSVEKKSLLNEDFWADVLSESGFEVQSSSSILAPSFNHACWRGEEDNLDYYYWGNSLRGL